MNRARCLLRATALLLALALDRPCLAPAHPVQFTTLQVRIEPDGRFHAALNIDVLAFALHKTSQASSNEELQALLDGPRPVLAAGLADAGVRFRREVVVRTNAGDTPVASWTLPGLDEVNAILARHLYPSIMMPGEIDFGGRLPSGAKTLSIRLPYILGDTVHVYELPADSFSQQVPAGAYAEPVALTGVEPSSSRPLGGMIVVGLVGLAAAVFSAIAVWRRRKSPP